MVRRDVALLPRHRGSVKVHISRSRTTYTANTPEQIVGILWKNAFVQETTPGEYMKAVSRRIVLSNGTHTSTKNATKFLEDLELAGVIRIDWRKE